MAQNVTELYYIPGNGTSQSFSDLICSVAPAASGTSIVVNPGNDTVNIVNTLGTIQTSGLRTIIWWSMSSSSASPSEPQGVISYNTGTNNNILTLTVGTNQTGLVRLTCVDSAIQTPYNAD